MRIGLGRLWIVTLMIMLMAMPTEAEPLSYDSRGREADFYRLTDLLEVAMPGDTVLVLNREDYPEVLRHVPVGIRVLLAPDGTRLVESGGRSDLKGTVSIHRSDVVTASLLPDHSGTRTSSDNPSDPPCTSPGQWLTDQLGGGYYQVQPGQHSIQRGIAEFPIPSLAPGCTITSAAMNFWTMSVSGNTSLNVFSVATMTAGVDPNDFNRSSRQIGQKTFDSESHGLSGPHTIGLDPKALIPGQSNKIILRNSDEESYCQG
ncbi:MAG: hypothetical protein KBA26_15450 [Candidatus Delongbacteria bacterium]|nr:hypothetical protein [Candidatus Delongbacteria bacterium]